MRAMADKTYARVVEVECLSAMDGVDRRTGCVCLCACVVCLCLSRCLVPEARNFFFISVFCPSSDHISILIPLFPLPFISHLLCSVFFSGRRCVRETAKRARTQKRGSLEEEREDGRSEGEERWVHPGNTPAEVCPQTTTWWAAFLYLFYARYNMVSFS